MAKGSASAEAKLVASLQAGKAKVQSLIKGDAADPKMATSEEARKGLYDGVLRMYEALTGGLAGALNEAYNETAQKAAVQAAKQIGEDALEVKFSKARLDNVLQIIHSGSVTDFCAVLTHKMGEQVVTALRAAVMEVLRRQAVEGLSAAEANKELQAAWARVANDANTYKFVDRGGRVWENARYFQMLVRTNSWRIWREIYLDTIASMGEDLVRISSDSGPEQCKVCKAWEGRILSVSGKDKRFPSYQDARAAGVFHPNCTHRLQAVLEGLTDDDLEEQAAENQARVDAGGSIGPTPPKPPKPGDYVPKKTHKKPKPAGPAPAKAEEDAAKKKAEDEQKAKKDAQAAKERVQALKDKGAALGAVEAALKASKANASAALGEAKVAYNDFSNLLGSVDCEVPEEVNDLLSKCSLPPGVCARAVSAATNALDPVEKAGSAMVHAVAAAKAEAPATIEAAETALADYEKALAEAKPKVEQAEKDAKAAAEEAAKCVEDAKAILGPLDKQAKAEKAAIAPKVQNLVAAADAALADLKAKLRDGTWGTTAAKSLEEAYKTKLADLTDEIAKATAVSAAVSAGWTKALQTVDRDQQDMAQERKAFDAAGSRVSKAYNAVKKDVADAEAAWNAGDGKTALAKLLAAAKKEGTLDTNFNDAAFQQYQGLVASYTSKVQAVKAELARVQALVGNAAGNTMQPPPQNAQPNAQAKPALADTATFPADPTKLKVVNEHPGGTTGAKIVQDENGTRWILKSEGKVSAEHIESEAAADKAYRALGVRVPECKVYKIGGKTYKLSAFVEGGKTFDEWARTATPKQRRDMEAQFREDFAVDCMFANRDVVGQGLDNIMVDSDGNLWRIDNGSSMSFRAQGAKKTGSDAFTEWPDDVFEMRSYQGKGLGTDRMTTAEICHSAVNRDWTAALAQLPPAERKIMERRLEEVRLLDVRATDYEANGYIPDSVEMVLDGSYNLAKAGTRQRVIDTQASFKADGHNYSGNSLFGWFRSVNARHGGSAGFTPAPLPTQKDFTSPIISAAKTIGTHCAPGAKQDFKPTQSTIDAALALEPELAKIAATGDPGAKTLLGHIQTIKKFQSQGWSASTVLPKIDPALKVVDPDVVAKIAQVQAANKAGAAAAKKNAPAQPKYSSFTKEVEAIAKQNGVDLGVVFRAFSDQGGNSWTGTAVKTKICQLAATGREWDPSAGRSPGVWYGDGAPVKHPRDDPDWRLKALQAQADIYKQHPDELQRDMQAFSWMKAASQTILENLDFENNDRGRRSVLVCRTEHPFVMQKNGRKLGAAGVNAISTAESSSVFHRTQAYSDTTETTVYEVPFSRITAMYFMEGSGGGDMFLGDHENELNIDFTGLPSAYVQRGSGVIRDYRAEYDRQMAAFRAKNP